MQDHTQELARTKQRLVDLELELHAAQQTASAYLTQLEHEKTVTQTLAGSLDGHGSSGSIVADREEISQLVSDMAVYRYDAYT